MVVLLIDAGMDASPLDGLQSSLHELSGEVVKRADEPAVAAALSDDNLCSLTMVVVTCGEDADACHRACHTVRTVTNVPLAVVSGSRREVDEIMAFANGCDDYICPTASPSVRSARLAALIARGRGGDGPPMAFGCLQLNPLLRTATVRGEPVPLTSTEFDLAEALIANQRRVVSRHELVERVWGGAHIPAHVLDVHLSRLRAKVLAVGGPKMGEAVRGVGYRVGTVTCDTGPCLP